MVGIAATAVKWFHKGAYPIFLIFSFNSDYL